MIHKHWNAGLRHRDALEQLIAMHQHFGDAATFYLFGSAARGTLQPESDLDFAVLLDTPRPPHLPVYRRIHINGLHVDLNVLDTSDCNRVIPDPHWQYRFIDFVQVRGASQRTQLVEIWVRNTQVWMLSAAARAHRIRVLRDRIVRSRHRA